jgi:cytochrome d ubiquinol oxidase subunit II
VAVAAVVVGWGVAQYPAVLVGSADIRDVAGADETLVALVVVLGLALVTVAPALVWLFRLVERPGWNRPVEGGSSP